MQSARPGKPEIQTGTMRELDRRKVTPAVVEHGLIRDRYAACGPTLATGASAEDPQRLPGRAGQWDSSMFCCIVHSTKTGAFATGPDPLHCRSK